MCVYLSNRQIQQKLDVGERPECYVSMPWTAGLLLRAYLTKRLKTNTLHINAAVSTTVMKIRGNIRRKEIKIWDGEHPCLFLGASLGVWFRISFELRLRRPRELGDRAFPWGAGSPLLKKVLDGIPRLQ